MRDDRRQAFKLIGGLLLGSVAASSGYYLVTREGAIDEWAPVGSVNELPVDDVVMKRVSVTEHGLLSDKPVEKVVWIRRRSGETVEVLSGACPHNNCTANWIPEKTQFDCRCHNSVFDPSGKVLSGPAPRPLDTLEHKIEGEKLLVRYQKFKKGVPDKELVG
jgi:Rieske Fe-S protein